MYYTVLIFIILAPKIGDDGLIFEDRPLPTAILQSIPTEVGLWKTAVVCTCIEANEDYIVVGSEQGYVWVIDLETYRLVREYNVSNTVRSFLGGGGRRAVCYFILLPSLPLLL